MLRLGALALAIGGAYDVGATQGFERGAVTVPGLVPQGCIRWEDGCNQCFVNGTTGVVIGCTVNACGAHDATDNPCCQGTPGICTQFLDGRTCKNGEDCSHDDERAKTCADKLAEAEAQHLGNSAKPQCDDNGNWLPRQTQGSTGCQWCTTNMGIEIEQTRSCPSDPDYKQREFTPGQCNDMGLAKVNEPCMTCAYPCPDRAQSGDGTCPRCGVGLRCIPTSFLGTAGPPEPGKVDGVCRVDAVSPKGNGPTGPCAKEGDTGDSQLDEAIRIMNSNIDNGMQEFWDNLFSTCNVHGLTVMCQEELPDDQMNNLARFCPSHCFTFMTMVLPHCQPGELAKDLEDAMRSNIAKCDAHGSDIVVH